MQKKILAPSPWQPLNGQGVLKISRLKLLTEKVAKRLGVRFGSWNDGSIFDRGMEMCEELRKRKVDVCCLQEVRWRGERARFIVSRKEVKAVVVRKCGQNRRRRYIGKRRTL